MEGALAFLTQNGISLITLTIVLVKVFAPTLREILQGSFKNKAERSKKANAWELEMEQRLFDRVLKNGPRANDLVDRMLLQQSANASAIQEQAERTEKIVTTAISVMLDFAGVATSTVKQNERHEKLMESHEQLLKEMLIALNRISQRLA